MIEVPEIMNCETREHCSVEVMNYLRENRVILNRVTETLEHVEKGNESVVKLLEGKIDDLIDALKGKDMGIPVATFKWLVIFVVAFSFITFFGRGAATEILSIVTGHAQAATE